jgi:Na+:H+ antiporter, NhaA family
MKTVKYNLINSLNQFLASEKSGGILLIFCTIVSLSITNSTFSEVYVNFWHLKLGLLSIEHWINDGLMAIFFLLIGLELEREIYSGELSSFKVALLPMIAAVGGMAVPALFHYTLNAGSEMQAGIGIPMATDIAFALAIIAILGNRIPPALKVFLVAFAVIDDLGAAILIAVFYTSNLSIAYLLAAIAVWLILIIFNRLRVMSMLPYIAGGFIMWILMLKSGVHATLAGIALAFAIPFSHIKNDADSPSHQLEQYLHKPVTFAILPVFALANTCILFSSNWFHAVISDQNSLGIIAGLVLGKPIGVTSFCLLAIALRICTLPYRVRWQHILGAGMLGGIGFTMSIFITNLAFVGNIEAINTSKIAILLSSALAGLIGYFWLRFVARIKR